MQPVEPAPDPWRTELVVVTRATGAERRALSRDVQRGRRLRLGPGMYVDPPGYLAMGPEAKHVVRMRALAAASDAPIVFSHWSAAVLHRLPVLQDRLEKVHAVVGTEAERHRRDVAQHVFSLQRAETWRVGELLVTSPARAVLDIAGATTLEEGVLAADALLVRGVPRSELEAAIELAGPRRAARRIADTVAFAHPGGESAAESRTRVTAYRLGVEVPQLQRRFVLSDGSSVFTDIWFPTADAVLEVDGDRKYLDPAMAHAGAGRVVLAEKRREDEVRAQVRAFTRSGWAQSGSIALLRPVLARIGVVPGARSTSFEEYCACARAASPRRTY